MNNPTVSVVIPTYNRARILPRAVKSVTSQTFEDWELLIVDDGSADDTEKVVASFGDPRIHLIRHEHNRGQSAARNTGIEAARGTYVSFLDSDDEWLPEKLAKEVAAFAAGGETVGLVYCGKELWDPEDRLLVRRLPEIQGDVYDQMLVRDFIGSCSRVALRKSVLKVIGGFDQSLPSYEDWDLWLRAAKVAKVAGVAEILVRRHVGGEQISESLRTIFEGRRIVVEKHHGEFDASQLSHHLAALSGILFNYDPQRARSLAFQSLRLRPFQPRVYASLVSSLLGLNAYRWLFSRYSGWRHGYYTGRARL